MYIKTSLVIFFLSVLILSGCATKYVCSDGSTVTNPSLCGSNQNNIPGSSQNSKNVPDYINQVTSKAQFIGNFIVLSKDDDNLEARFSLLDGNKNYIVEEGIANFRILDAKKNEIYSKQISVRKDGFGMYTLTLTKEEFMAYVWAIPKKDIKKSNQISGTAYLKFSSGTSSFDELETTVYGLPEYSEQELEQLNEEAYTKNAIAVNQKLSKGDWEITVTNMGFYTPIVTYGDEKEYFRVDLKVKSIANAAEYFSPSGMVILDNAGNQYESGFGGTLRTFSQIYPGITKEG